MKFAWNSTSILLSCSPWQRPTSQPIFDCAILCDIVSPKDWKWKRCGQTLFRTGLEEKMVVFLSCCYSAQIVLFSSWWCVAVYWMCQLFGQSHDGSSFLAFSLADLRGAATREVAVADRGERMSLLVVARDRGCAPSMLTKKSLKQGHCWEEVIVETMIMAMKVTWVSQGGLRRRLPSPRGLLTHSLSSGDVRPVSACQRRREEREREKVSVCAILAIIK